MTITFRTLAVVVGIVTLSNSYTASADTTAPICTPTQLTQMAKKRHAVDAITCKNDVKPQIKVDETYSIKVSCTGNDWEVRDFRGMVLECVEVLPNQAKIHFKQ